MIVYYRISQNQTKAPRPFGITTKFVLVYYCFKSFIKAFENVKPKVVFIMDDCSEAYYDLVKQCPFEYEVINFNQGSQQSSYFLQLDMVEKENDFVLFQEDDYWYLPNTGEKLLEGMKNLGFVNPYDHLEFYTKPEYHPEDCKIRLVGDQHWRSDAFNTMTYGGHSDLFKKHMPAFRKYGFWDKPTWEELKKEGVLLWSPIPTFATHMVDGFLSAGVDWKKLYEESKN